MPTASGPSFPTVNGNGAVTPTGGLSTDVGMIISAAFPNGKPEMAAGDFKRAYEITKASLGGKPRPGRKSLDFPTWAHCMMVEWKLQCEQAKAKKLPEPSHLTCPECGVMMLLDHTQSNILTCPGGCNRAITMQAFTALFRNVSPTSRKVSSPSRPRVNLSGLNNAPGNVIQTGGLQSLGGSGGASIGGTIPPGSDPVAEGIVEKMPKSKKPLTSWRIWHVEDKAPARLKSISYQELWPPMEPIHAKCQGKDREQIDHECPSWHHRCGVYSVKRLMDIQKWATNRESTAGRCFVVGEIEMWGRVLEYRDGYRSEYAYPLRLWVPKDFPADGYKAWKTPEELAERLWEQYLVEVNVNSDIVLNLVQRD